MPFGLLPAAIAPHDHLAQFSSCEDELAQSAAGYLYEGLQAGGAVVIVATPSRRAAIEGRLTAAGIDVPSALDEGRVLCLDAGEALDRFIVGGRPDRSLFRALIGSAVRRSGTTGWTVHVYGEMVDLLWRAGHVSCALELEALWNDLQEEVPFSLLCSYRSEFLLDEDCADVFEELCWSHSAIMRERTDGDAGQTGRVEPTEASRAFPPDSRSPCAARRFVIENLRGWADDRLLGDAGLVATELATNAVLHGRSAFTVTVAAVDDSLRVSVRDAGTEGWAPSGRALNAGEALGLGTGRGLALIAALAARCGMRPLDNGNIVWADLSWQRKPHWNNADVIL
jgi:anti-sigma regulatory factor (Ser/Thr protein kinase)